MGEGLPLYHVERTVEETGKKFGDGSHIIYVNGAYKNDNDPIGRLVHDFGCVRSADMFNDLLKEQVRYFKETEEGKEAMCEIIENVAKKRAEETRINVITENIKSLMGTMKLSATQAFDALHVSSADREAVNKRI